MCGIMISKREKHERQLIRFQPNEIKIRTGERASGRVSESEKGKEWRNMFKANENRYFFLDFTQQTLCGYKPGSAKQDFLYCSATIKDPINKHQLAFLLLRHLLINSMESQEARDSHSQ